MILADKPCSSFQRGLPERIVYPFACPVAGAGLLLRRDSRGQL
jgi:hypothetical protein